MHSELWLTASILHAVAATQPADDSKRFTDRPCRTSPEAALAAFEKALVGEGDVTADVLKLLETHFLPAGSDVEPCFPTDFAAEPPGFMNHLLPVPHIREWALQVHALWPELCRKTSNPVSADAGTLLSLPHPFIIPGSRFREMYYWDTYWVLEGLLISGMPATARGMVLNLLHLLSEHGHVPNGARAYYLNRSQPPLLSRMVALLHRHTPDLQLLQMALPLLVKEHAYWTTGRKAVSVRSADRQVVHQLSRYYADWQQPRPESYKEDVATAKGMAPAEAAQLFTELASAAESGWDFSSRWLADGGDLASVRTTLTVPADLNAFLYRMELDIAGFAAELAEAETAAAFQRRAQQRQAAIQDLMWGESAGQWRDLLLDDQVEGDFWVVSQSSCSTAASFVPLWCGLAAARSQQAFAACAALAASGLVQPGGVAASLCRSGQQWDAPNAWPPLQAMLIDGATTFGGAPGQRLAKQMAQSFLANMYACWMGDQHPGVMLEKYDASAPGKGGGGGEYVNQTGFGWTNGLALLLLQQYGSAVWLAVTSEDGS